MSTSEDMGIQALNWREINPYDSPLLIGTVQLRRYRLYYGYEPRDLEIVLWHHDSEIRNVFIPEYDSDQYSVELIALRTNGQFNILISRSDTDSQQEANMFVQMYQTICTAGLEALVGE